MTEPGVVALHVDDVPLRAVVDQVAGGGLVVVPVLGGDMYIQAYSRLFTSISQKPPLIGPFRAS